MSMTDPIADMLTRIRNACRAKHSRVDVPLSKMKMEIADILQREAYIQSYRRVDDDKQGLIRIALKYTPEGESVILGLRRVSTPGRRVYVRATRIPRVRGGYGTALISTPRGVLTGGEARRGGVGGELLCYVW
jgi:small subunit ribosomal protein S8